MLNIGSFYVPLDNNVTQRQIKHKRSALLRENLRLARRFCPSGLSKTSLSQLRDLTESFLMSLKLGDLQLLGAGWYVTHTGLLRLARRKKCCGIQVEAVDSLCESIASRFVMKATVHPSKGSTGFVGYGDADPSNVSPIVRGAEMRVAETRAVNRALRKAYGLGLCSVEELGAGDRDREPLVEQHREPPHHTSRNGNENGDGNSGPRVRDRLCQLIRQHHLDPDLVKAYAIDYCGTSSLKQAARAQVEEFVRHLAEWAGRDRDALLCQLNRYPRIAPTSETKDRPTEGAA